MKIRTLISAAVSAVAVLGTTNTAVADVGSGANSASASVNFSITVPSFLRFRVGTNAAGADTIAMAPSAAQMDTGTSVAATGGDASCGAGCVTWSVSTNAGTNSANPAVRINYTAGGGTIGVGTAPGWDEVAVTAGGTVALHNSPLSATANTEALQGCSASAAGVVNATSCTGTWTYSYRNTQAYPDGTYTGTVVYTATAL